MEAGAVGPETGLALWGTGKPRREFLYVEDVGRAITFCLQNVHAADVPDGLLNVGCGEDLTIRELADIVQRVVGYEGPVLWDDSRPDGTPRKLMDVTRIRSLGWAPEVGPGGRHPPHLRLVPGQPRLAPRAATRSSISAWPRPCSARQLEPSRPHAARPSGVRSTHSDCGRTSAPRCGHTPDHNRG